jgi:hypothetical protein
MKDFDWRSFPWLCRIPRSHQMKVFECLSCTRQAGICVLSWKVRHSPSLHLRSPSNIDCEYYNPARICKRRKEAISHITRLGRRVKSGWLKVFRWRRIRQFDKKIPLSQVKLVNSSNIVRDAQNIVDKGAPWTLVRDRAYSTQSWVFFSKDSDKMWCWIYATHWGRIWRKHKTTAN